uniref:Thioredoxin domain-containing protein 3 n=1 Tax=Nannospalax galili TaxID=1026970 RepID=A0A8C6QMP4_NANGA
MAGKKREAQLQTIINSQSLWDEMLLNKGLTVIDVYQAWCGPCKAMQTLFRKLKNELNEDDILHFAVAEADNIVTLQSFRDKCEPVFLFSLNGKIIAKIQGANAPLINKKVINLIDEERRAVAGEIDRPQYNEILLTDVSEEESGGGHYENIGETCSIAIIKPDAVLRRKCVEIKEKITKEGFVIEAEENMLLSEELVREFYSHRADQPDFEEFVSFMTTGLSCVLIVSQGEEPGSPQQQPELYTNAKAEESSEYIKFMPLVTKKKWDSLQESLERQHISQYCEVEDNMVKVSMLINILFPDFKAMKSMKLQKTLAVLRPEVLEAKRDDILNIIHEEGFKILMQRQLVLSDEEVKTLFKDHENEDYFNRFIAYTTSGPSLALVLLRENAVEHWKELLGPRTVNEANESNPKSLCAQFAMGSFPVNQLYGSNSTETAEKEIEYFFPVQNLLAVIKPHVKHKQRAEILKLIKEAGFMITQLKEMQLFQEHIDKIYFKIVGKDFYKHLLESLSEGPSTVMVLTKWNAVAEWRQMMGPVDPEEARLLSPDSIRAKFGIDILRNAVHGSSSLSEATETINTFFIDDVLDDP